jgi:hypothetical protein
MTNDSMKLQDAVDVAATDGWRQKNDVLPDSHTSDKALANVTD